MTRVTEPDESTIAALKAAVDPIEADAERAAHVQTAIAALVADGADPALVGRLAALAWHQGWVTGWDERGAPGGGVSRNPYETGQS